MSSETELNLPMVTVVCPSHNHAHWINDALISIARQDYPRKQIVVVDDGSSDGSPQHIVNNLRAAAQTETGGIVGYYRETDTKLMLLAHTQARGPSFARNVGIKAAWAATDLFCFLDSDDIYEQGKITKSVDKWLASPDLVGVVYSDFDTFNPITGLRLRQFKEPYDRILLTQECIINCDSLVSKKALETCGFFDEQLRTVEDMDLWLRITERFLAIHIPESLVRIRVGNHSSSAQISTENWQRNYSYVMQKLQARLNGQKQ